MSTIPRNPEETDDEWSRRTEAELAAGAREKAEAPGPNAKASVRDMMTSGPPDMGRKGWQKPFIWMRRWKFWGPS